MGGILSVTEEYNTIGNKSLKSTTDNGSVTSIDVIYIINEEQIGHTGTVSLDVYSTSNFMAYLIFRNNSSSGQASIKSNIWVPANESTHITLTIPEILSNTYSVFVRLHNNNKDDIFMDNCILNF